MIKTKDLVEFMQQLPFQQDLPFAIEYRAEVVARLRAYDRITTCPRKSNTVDTKRLLRVLGAMHHDCIQDNWDNETEQDYKEIVARLEHYDKLKEGIEKLLARMSNGVDNE